MKSKLLSTILLFVICNCSTDAQITFQKTYTGNSNCIQQTFDGGFVIVGTAISVGAGDGDVLLIKTNSAGDTLWTKSFGGSGTEYGYAVQQTTDSGFIIAATTNSFSAGINDAYLIKTNSSGDVIWTKTYGSASDQDYGYGVKQTTDGGYILAGVKNNVVSFDNDMYLVKTDANGDTLWTKIYGGSNHDEAYDVEQTTDGGYILAGARFLGAGSADIYIIKTNATGDTLWTKEYGGPDVDYGYAIEQTSDGGYIIGGHTQMGSGVWDALLIKINDVGDLLWSKTYGGAAVDYLYSVQQTTDGGYLIGGTTNNFGAGNYDMYMIKTNSNGDTLWTKAYGGTGEDRGYYAVQANDGGYIIAGYATSFVGTGLEVYLVKTDANGNTDCNSSNTATIVTVPATQVNSTPTIVSNPAAAVTAPATITHSGATVTVLCLGNGAYEISVENNSINISPNPANEFAVCNFQNSDLKNSQLKIYGVLGKEIYSSTVTAQNFKLETRNYPEGIYFIQLIADKKTVTEKLIISH